VLIARNEQALLSVASGLDTSSGFPPIVLPLDLALPNAAGRVAAELAAQGVEPQYVINNAGFGLLGPAAELDRGEQLGMVDLNVRALVDLSLAFVDSLARHRGGILNLSSLAGFMPGPGMAAYYATKAFVLSFTEALHYELAERGIRVTVLCPGPVPTDFQRRAGFRISGAARLFAVSAERTAREGYDGLMRGRRCVVPGWPNKLVPWLPRLLPRGLVLEIMARSQEKRTDEAGR
jgi:short-subunit dehydrogenase